MLDLSAQIIKEPLWEPSHDHEKGKAFMRRFYPNIDKIVDTTAQHDPFTVHRYEFEYNPGPAAGGACFSILNAVRSTPDKEPMEGMELMDETKTWRHYLLEPRDFTFGDHNSRARLLWGDIDQSENRWETYGVCFADRQLDFWVNVPIMDFPPRTFTVIVQRGLPLDSGWFGRPLEYVLRQGRPFVHFR